MCSTTIVNGHSDGRAPVTTDAPLLCWQRRPPRFLLTYRRRCGDDRTGVGFVCPELESFPYGEVPSIRSPVVGQPVDDRSRCRVLSVATQRSRAYSAKEAHHHRVRLGVRLRRSSGCCLSASCSWSIARDQWRPCRDSTILRG